MLDPFGRLNYGFGFNRMGAAQSAASQLLGAEPAGFVFDPANDQVLVRGNGMVPDFFGTVQQATDGAILSFTRATSAGRINALGNHEVVSSGVWRRQYDPLTLQPLGYLAELQQTNNFDYSSPLSTGWATGVASRAASAEITPDGGTNGTLLTATGTSFPRVVKSSPRSLTSGSTYTRSMTVKAGTTPYVHGTIEATGQTVRFYADLSLGVVSTSVSAGTATAVARIVARGGGWFRISITVTVATTAAYGYFIGPSGSYLSPTAAVGDSIHLWHAQDEDGAYPTSEIIATGSTVTRNADVMTGDPSKLPFSATAGTMIATAQPSPAAEPFNHVLWSLSDGTMDNAILDRAGATADMRRGQIFSGAASQASIQTAVAAGFKSALAWAANDAEYVIGGASIGIDTSVTVPTVTTLGIGVQGGLVQYGAPIESLVYVPRRLTQAEMIARTA